MNGHSNRYSPTAGGRFGWSIAVVFAFLALAGSEAWAQTNPSADAGAADSVIQVFRHPSGVEIHLLQLRPGVGNDEMIDALESVVRLLRKNGKVTPVAHQEPAAPPPTVTAQVEPAPPPVPVDPPPAAPVCSGSRQTSGEVPDIARKSGDFRYEVPAAGPPTVAALSCETASAELPHWYDQFKLAGLPATLLWQLPMANELQPRMALQLSSLNNATTSQTTDTAIGAEFGLFRITPASAGNWAFEPDIFAVAIGRFSLDRDFTAADFRFGFPLTFAYDNWHAKIGYEHTSTHLGDDFIRDFGVFKQGNIHNEVVVGLDYVFADQLRLYGVFAGSLTYVTPTPSHGERYDWGVEWSQNRTTDWKGQPFMAFDMELRGDQDFVADLSLQLGWQWKEMDTGRSFRTGVELYDGRSPYGQFYLIREKWVAFGAWVDF